MQDYKVMQSESMRIFRLLREKAAYEKQKKKKKKAKEKKKRTPLYERESRLW